MAHIESLVPVLGYPLPLQSQKRVCHDECRSFYLSITWIPDNTFGLTVRELRTAPVKSVRSAPKLVEPRPSIPRWFPLRAPDPDRVDNARAWSEQ